MCWPASSASFFGKIFFGFYRFFFFSGKFNGRFLEYTYVLCYCVILAGGPARVWRTALTAQRTQIINAQSVITMLELMWDRRTEHEDSKQHRLIPTCQYYDMTYNTESYNAGIYSNAIGCGSERSLLQVAGVFMLFDAIDFDMLVMDVNLMDFNKVSLKGNIYWFSLFLPFLQCLQCHIMMK